VQPDVLCVRGVIDDSAVDLVEQVVTVGFPDRLVTVGVKDQYSRVDGAGMQEFQHFPFQWLTEVVAERDSLDPNAPPGVGDKPHDARLSTLPASVDVEDSALANSLIRAD
jgi:hypothetical protein